MTMILGGLSRCRSACEALLSHCDAANDVGVAKQVLAVIVCTSDWVVIRLYG